MNCGHVLMAERVNMKHGCCVDKACNSDTCMELPLGKTCGDCLSFLRCKGIMGLTGRETYCDWFPRVFREKPGSDVVGEAGKSEKTLK